MVIMRTALVQKMNCRSVVVQLSLFMVLNIDQFTSIYMIYNDIFLLARLLHHDNALIANKYKLMLKTHLLMSN